MVQLEGLDNLENLSDLIGKPTRVLPACSLAPQQPTEPLVVLMRTLLADGTLNFVCSNVYTDLDHLNWTFRPKPGWMIDVALQRHLVSCSSIAFIHKYKCSGWKIVSTINIKCTSSLQTRVKYKDRTTSHRAHISTLSHVRTYYYVFSLFYSLRNRPLEHAAVCLKLASDVANTSILNTKTNSVALSPRANYTDWATATCQRNLAPTSVDTWVSRGQRGGSPTVVNLSFLDRSRYFSFK
jgi:hypothetical protein